MKHKTVFYLAAAIIVNLAYLQHGVLEARTIFSHQDVNPIEITPKSPVGNPRSGVINPFVAYYSSDNVVLSCTTEYGVVNVNLISTAGDNYSSAFDTEDGAILIPISGDPGYYTLTIIDQNGQLFYGEFEI